MLSRPEKPGREQPIQGSLTSYPGLMHATAFAVSGPWGQIALHHVTSSGIDLTRPFQANRLLYFLTIRWAFAGWKRLATQPSFPVFRTFIVTRSFNSKQGICGCLIFFARDCVMLKRHFQLYHG